MKLPLYWIDAFTDRVFSGNPAAVVPLEQWIPDALMQRIAFENGLAETAFFVRTGDARFHLRWFTPTVEVELCGHATLASAHVLYFLLGQTGDTIVFDSRSGPLMARRRTDGKIELDFPATPPVEEKDENVTRAVSEALNHAPVWMGRTRFDRFAMLADAVSIRALKPDLVRLAATGTRGLIVTAPGDGACDFVSRFFAPQSGIPEDPATGSSHCALCPYWAARLGRTQLHAFQLSARGGEFWCELTISDRADSAANRVRIAGSAAYYLGGTLKI